MVGGVTSGVTSTVNVCCAFTPSFRQTNNADRASRTLMLLSRPSTTQLTSK
jgi:hypothetical protein